MVRKIMRTIIVTLLLLSGAATTAFAEDVYSGTISSTFTSIAQQIEIPLTDDYVFFRSDQYEYVLIVGDLSFVDNVFTLESSGKKYVITQVTSSSSGFGSSSYYSYEVEEVAACTVNTNGILVYSNIGDYPILNDRGDIYVCACTFVICIVSLCALVRSVFSFVLRCQR